MVFKELQLKQDRLSNWFQVPNRPKSSDFKVRAVSISAQSQLFCWLLRGSKSNHRPHQPGVSKA